MGKNSLNLGVDNTEIYNKTGEYKSKYWFEMKEKFDDIIKLILKSTNDECLNKDCVECDTNTPKNCINEEIFRKIIQYQKMYPKIVYSVLSSSVESLEDEKRAIFTNRVYKCIEVLGDWERKEKDAELNSGYKKVQEFFIKILDHYELLCNQKLEKSGIKSLNKLTNDRASKIEKKMNKLEIRTLNRINEKINALQTQMISIVSIFVTISFVMFGGMNLFNGLFSNSSNSIFHTIALGSLFGIVMITMIIVFVMLIMYISGNYKKEGLRKTTKKFEIIKIYCRNTLIFLGTVFICSCLVMHLDDLIIFIKMICNCFR